MREGDLIEGTIARLDSEGDGVLEADGRAILVPGAFPGEVVRARVLHLAKRRPLGHAKRIELVTPRDERREAACAQHETRGGRCTGCPLLPLAEDAQREALRAMLEREHGLRVDRVRAREDGALGYRWSSKRIVFGGRLKARLGSFARGSHIPADMAGCLLEHPAIERAFAEVVAVLNELDVEPFDERYGSGELRYVWAKTDGERVLLTLVTAKDDRALADRIANALTVPSAVAWSVQQPGGGNALRGTEPVMLRGRALEATIAGVPVEIGPLGFLQPNPPVIAEAYRELVSAPSGEPRAGALAFDLYAGAGITTALLRRSFDRVIPCESYPESAATLGVPPRSVADFLAEVLASDDSALRAPELVVANPPRRGIGADVAELLRRLGARHVQIMACGPAGLAADLARLCEGGFYRLVRLEAFETLPQTPHVELVAWLERT